MVKDRVIKSEKIYWRRCEWFQPETLKKVTDDDFNKLQDNIKKYGVIRGFKVWEKEGTLYILDGHLLQKVLLSLPDDVPERLSAEFIECDDEKQAAEFVIYYSSFWHRFANEGLFAFTEQYGIVIPELGVNLPQMYLFNSEKQVDYDEMWAGMPEFDNENLKPFKTIKVHFDNAHDMNSFANLVKQTVTENTTYIWFPKKEKLDLVNYKVDDA